ncbi:transposase [Colletotrichum incanum]|uniref:Transposase n=1 Tax=Colletotrichum incanum TaxID=1573173 RepID=A0A162QAV4_COLIC|nr:transposase [Colletotrichum incanum]
MDKYLVCPRIGFYLLVLLIKCISTAGNFLHPRVIYKDLQPYAGWSFTATDNGWTTDETALEWLKKVFIPQTAPSQPGEARLLILDAYHSYITTEFMWRCFRNNIYVLFLPPHTSHARNFIDCYRKTRLDALNSQIIKSGWNYTGL